MLQDVIEVSDIYASALHHVSPVYNESTINDGMQSQRKNLQFLHGAVMHTM